jgi:hypothetical protein
MALSVRHFFLGEQLRFDHDKFLVACRDWEHYPRKGATRAPIRGWFEPALPLVVAGIVEYKKKR